MLECLFCEASGGWGDLPVTAQGRSLEKQRLFKDWVYSGQIPVFETMLPPVRLFVVILPVV